MGFRIVNAPYVTWIEVLIRQLDEDGAERQSRIRLKCKLLDDDELSRRLADGEHDAIRALLGEVILDWEGVEDADGQPLPFDGGLLARLLGHPFFAKPVVAAYTAAREGRRAKN